MKITILPQGTLAIYEQIVNQLKNAVVTGELKAGEALPSIRALAADLGVSVITTKRAYEELKRENPALSAFKGIPNVYIDTTNLTTDETFQIALGELKKLAII